MYTLSCEFSCWLNLKANLVSIFWYRLSLDRPQSYFAFLAMICRGRHLEYNGLCKKQVDQTPTEAVEFSTNVPLAGDAVPSPHSHLSVVSVRLPVWVRGRRSKNLRHRLELYSLNLGSKDTQYSKFLFLTLLGTIVWSRARLRFNGTRTR